MDGISLKNYDWTNASVWFSEIFPKVFAGTKLDFSGIEQLRRSDIEPLFAGLKSAGLSEAVLLERLGASSMSPEVARVILPIFNLKPPERETPAEFSNNPFRQLDEIQQTYKSYVDTFVTVKDDGIRAWLENKVAEDNLLWNPPFLQVKRRYKSGISLPDMIATGWLPEAAKRVFRLSLEDPNDPRFIHPHHHQSEALRLASEEKNFVVVTGTGSGKSFAFGLPVIADALRRRGQPGIKAVIIYPMNALANSQYQDFALRLHGSGLKIALYTGDTPGSKEEGRSLKEQLERQRSEGFVSDAEILSRVEIRDNPPDILMTNYVQLELLLTRGEDKTLFPATQRGVLRYLVLDEVHTYAGKRGAEVASLIRRLKQHTQTIGSLQVIGTSATVDSGEEESADLAICKFASRLFGEEVNDVVKEIYAVQEGLSDSFLPAEIALSPEDIKGFDGSKSKLFELAEKALGRALDEGEKTAEGLGLAFAHYAPLHYAEQRLFERSMPLAELLKDYSDTYRPGFDPALVEAELQAALFIGQYAKVWVEGELERRIVLKLHAFYSQGLGVSATLTNPPELSIKGEVQLKLEGVTESVKAYPLVFCRVCGQDYRVAELNGEVLGPGQFGELSENSYYLMPGVWKAEEAPLPEDWLTPKRQELKKQYAGHEPQNIKLDPLKGTFGSVAPFILLKAPFLFCPNCQTAYDGRTRSEYNKLIPYGMVGRSTATDILIGRTLDVLPKRQQKVIAFTDNRQDTEFQAAHFQDLSRKIAFRQSVVQVLKDSPSGRLELSELGTQVRNFWKTEDKRENLEDLYDANSPAGRAFHSLLRGFAIADASRSQQPNILNLEEAGVIRYDYPRLSELVEDEAFWNKEASGLETAARHDLLRGFCDLLRRRDGSFDPAIYRSDVFRFDIQDALAKYPGELFWEPSTPNLFTLSEQPQLRFGKTVALYRSKGSSKVQAWVMRVLECGPELAARFIASLVKRLEALKILTYESLNAYHQKQAHGYLLNPSRIQLVLIDPEELRVCPRSRMVCHNQVLEWSPEFPNTRLQTRRVRGYFQQQYSHLLRLALGEAAAHSGQLDGEARRTVENRFRDPDDKLNLLVATPTMEMGIDIGALSAVYMRNVPPSPANYAQRSGRAGRKGQASLVQVFCGGGQARGPHDQYFYRFPEKMISGQVNAPRFLLDNKRLLSSHIHALSLEILTQYQNLSLPSTVPDLLNVDKANERYPMKSDMKLELERALAAERVRILDAVKAAFAKEMQDFDWFNGSFIETTVDNFLPTLDADMTDWRSDYQEATGDYAILNKRLENISKASEQYDELEHELRRARDRFNYLLGKSSERKQPGLDLRRYLGGQGFLPNYAFPPRAKRIQFLGAEFSELERPPSVALREIAPGNSLYYKGQRFQVTRANIPESEFNTRRAKRCPECKRLTLVERSNERAERQASFEQLNSCPSCGTDLSAISASIEAIDLPVMQAEPRARITSNDEERMRRGFKLSTDYKAQRQSVITLGLAEADAHLGYEHNATLSMVNAGPQSLDVEGDSGLDGFAYCMACKKWLFTDDAILKHASAEGTGNCTRSAKPDDIKRSLALFIEQRSDVLSLDMPVPFYLKESQHQAFYESLQTALRHGALITLELESSELGSFLLKQASGQTPYRIILHETSEGGLGALASLQETGNFRKLIRNTLSLVHEADEDACETACYACLLSYGNQMVHSLLDRQLIMPSLRSLALAEFSAGANSDRLTHLLRLCESEYERRFLHRLVALGIPLPDAQRTALEVTPGIITIPDFSYQTGLSIYIDGEQHDQEPYKTRDQTIRSAMDAFGYSYVVLRFDDDWEQKLESLRSLVT